MMALQQTASTRPCIGCSRARVSAPRPARVSQIAVRREVIVRGLKDDLIGRVNNPEETRENAQKKKTEGQWAEPTNKNPLEKTGAAHGIGAGGAATPGGGEDTSDVAEKAKEGVDNVVEGLKDAAKKVTGNDK